VPAIKRAYDSKEFQEFMRQRGFGVVYADPQGFARFMEKGDADMGVVMKAVGIAK
jgi:tripartite-type tricarboxylate transporter receptor subunit TctC